MKTYGTEPNRPRPRRVGIADLVVERGDEPLIATGLGSCLAIALCDPTTDIGGFAHVMLPNGDVAGADGTRPGKYADTAIHTLLRRMVEQGASYPSIEAKLAGGSDMFDLDGFDESVGTRNVEAAKAALETLDIPLVGEDVGGNYGRNVTFTPETGAFVVEVAANDREVRTL